MVPSIATPRQKSIIYQSFVYVQFNDQTVIFRTTALFDPLIGPYQVIPLKAIRNLKAMTPHSPKLQHYWSHTIRLFSVAPRKLAGWVLPLCRDAVGVFYRPSRLSYYLKRYSNYIKFKVLKN